MKKDFPKGKRIFFAVLLLSHYFFHRTVRSKQLLMKATYRLKKVTNVSKIEISLMQEHKIFLTKSTKNQLCIQAFNQNID